MHAQTELKTDFRKDAQDTLFNLLGSQIENSRNKIDLDLQDTDKGIAIQISLNDKAHPNDRGFLLGKNGRVMESIRTLMITFGARYKKQIYVKLV